MNEYYVEYFDSVLGIQAFTLIEAVSESEARMIFERECSSDTFMHIEEYEAGTAMDSLCGY